MKLAVLAILGASVAAASDSPITVVARQATTATSASSISSPPLTTVEPSLTLTSTHEDPWHCATQNLSQYFDVPKPSGTLSAAIGTYIEELAGPCVETATGLDLLDCQVTEPAQLCGFTAYASATPALVTAFASHESAAASFWRSNSESVSVLSVECASAWARFGDFAHAWLNQTIAYAGCVLDDDLPPVSTTTTGSSSSGSGSATAPGTGVTGTTSSATNTAKLAVKMDLWMLAGTGVIVGAANAFA